MSALVRTCKLKVLRMTSLTKRSKSEVDMLAHAFPNSWDRRTTPCVARELPEATPEARYALERPQVECFVRDGCHGSRCRMDLSAEALYGAKRTTASGTRVSSGTRIIFGGLQQAISATPSVGVRSFPGSSAVLIGTNSISDR
jgi:hypothetical protein